MAVAVVREDDLFCQKWYIKGKISASPQPLSGADLPVVDLDQYNNNLLKTDPYGKAMKK